MVLEKIISGGQNGADRAALDAAKKLGISTGGMAPKNWRVCLYDGTNGSAPELADYGLIESESYTYPPRTIHNVVNSDGTVWFGYENSPGGKLTIKTAKTNSKPVIINPTSEELLDWLLEFDIKIMNVAGNRVSAQNPNIYQIVYDRLLETFYFD